MPFARFPLGKDVINIFMIKKKTKPFFTQSHAQTGLENSNDYIDYCMLVFAENIHDNVYTLNLYTKILTYDIQA